MTTPRIEEIIESNKKYENYQGVIMMSEEHLRQALTQAYQAGIDEAVRVMEEKKQTKVFKLVKHHAPDSLETITMPADYESAFHLGEKIALDDTIKALQDNQPLP